MTESHPARKPDEIGPARDRQEQIESGKTLLNGPVLAGEFLVPNENNRETVRTLQRSNVELALAYDATIEGFARALDLREAESAGHTQRVAEMTAHLAKALGLDEQALMHAKRGALLHDIGKLGVPESILQKPGQLTDEEWVAMRKHPQIAYDLLSPVVFLYPALDIPYCHHEKWDGSGYPQGLRGEAIPLAARLFSIVDVWDSLTSKKPYRSAWLEEKALAYIREQSGRHFDPSVVEAFLKVVPAGG